jgi:hypothetical protein
MATAFNLTWLRNGTATATANIPMGTYKFTGLGNGTANGDSIAYGQTADAVIYGLTIGRGAGSVSTNTAVGASVLNGNSTGAYNTAVGYQAAYSSTNGYTTAVGYQAGYGITTGQENVLMGYQAGKAITTGNVNCAFGDSALVATTTGSNNVAMGQQSLYSNTTASNNTAVGYQAGYSNTTAGGNTFLGYQSGYTANRTADTSAFNVCAGYIAGYNLTTSQYNTLVGPTAGWQITTGAKNTVLGAYGGNQGGLDIRTASNYIVLSDGDGNPRGVFDGSGNFLMGATSQVYSGFATLQYAGNLKNGITLNDTDTGAGGNAPLVFRRNGTNVGLVTTTTSSTAYNTSSDYRLKENVEPMQNALVKVAQLKPCTYTWKADGASGQGFIAHELQAVVSEAVTGEKDAVDADGNPVYQGIDTSFLVATLTAAIQELNAKVDAQAALIATQSSEIAALKGQA